MRHFLSPDLSFLSKAWKDSGPALVRFLCYLLLPSPPVLPGAFILQETLRTHGSCTGLRRIQVCIDRGLVSHIPRLPGRRPAPRRWLKNTPPRLEGQGCGQGTLSPSHWLLLPLPPSRAVSLGPGGFGSQEAPWHKDSGGQIDPRVGRKEGSLGSVLLSPPVAGGIGWVGPSWLLTDGAFSIFLPPAWAALELSRGAVGQRGVSRGAAWPCSWITVAGLSPIWWAWPRVTAPRLQTLSTLSLAILPPSRLSPDPSGFSPSFLLSSSLLVRRPQDPPAGIADVPPPGVQLRPRGPQSPEQQQREQQPRPHGGQCSGRAWVSLAPTAPNPLPASSPGFS